MPSKIVTDIPIDNAVMDRSALEFTAMKKRDDRLINLVMISVFVICFVFFAGACSVRFELYIIM